MKLPATILRRVRGPLLAATVMGCSSAPATTPISQESPSPITATAAVAVDREPVDPVAYDASTESARLQRLDRAVASAETRRTQRIEGEQRARRRVVRQALPASFGGPNQVIYLDALCGRG